MSKEIEKNQIRLGVDEIKPERQSKTFTKKDGRRYLEEKRKHDEQSIANMINSLRRDPDEPQS